MTSHPIPRCLKGFIVLTVLCLIAGGILIAQGSPWWALLPLVASIGFAGLALFLACLWKGDPPATPEQRELGKWLARERTERMLEEFKKNHPPADHGPLPEWVANLYEKGRDIEQP